MKIENCLLFHKVYFIEQIEMMLDQRYTDPNPLQFQQAIRRSAHIEVPISAEASKLPSHTSISVLPIGLALDLSTSFTHRDIEQPDFPPFSRATPP